MVALCVEHAHKADGGSFTNEQLIAFKREGRVHAEAVSGRFDWMRRELLAVVGGNFYYHCPVIFEIGDRKAIWFTRDDSGSLLLNFWIPTASGEERARVSENFWIVPPAVKDLECPPSGKRIHVHYPNNDESSGSNSSKFNPSKVCALDTEKWLESLIGRTFLGRSPVLNSGKRPLARQSTSVQECHDYPDSKYAGVS